MKTSFIFILLLSILLTACEWMPGLQVPSTPGVEPSRTPSILHPTPVIPLPTGTPSPNPDPSETSEGIPLTGTASPFPVPTATLTATPPAPLQVEIVGCNTSLDISHGMGEVTNAYALVRNFSGQDLANVCATLIAIDEDRQHPDKTVCLASLPTRNQVLLKLTVDTQFRVDTYIWVDVETDQGLSASVVEESCRDIGLFRGDPGETGEIEPIP